MIGEGEYNLNVLKEIAATDSYLGMHENVRGCQNRESQHNCTTRHYLDALQAKCGCFPINIQVSDEVLVNLNYLSTDELIV